MVGGDGCGEGVELLDILPVNLFRFVVGCGGFVAFPYNKRKTSLCSR